MEIDIIRSCKIKDLQVGVHFMKGRRMYLLVGENKARRIERLHLSQVAIGDVLPQKADEEVTEIRLSNFVVVDNPPPRGSKKA